MSSIPYRPEIDGLRALAVLAVIAFHINPSWPSGGFVGVDIFFVISGYLITSIILAELADGTFSFGSFWERRIRRIIPPLVVMMIGVMLIYLLLRIPAEATSSLGHQVFRVVSLTANHFINSATGDYWGPAAESMPLLHTWSLAVEEQFYLIFPFVVYLLWRKNGGATRVEFCGMVFAVIAAASLVACILHTRTNQSSAFFLLPYRAWELVAGSLIAVYPRTLSGGRQNKSNPVIADLGMLLMLSAVFFINSSAYPGWKALLPVAGALLYITYSGQGSTTAKLLSTPSAVYIGKVSYSLYLWHWPALVLGGMFEQAWVRPVALAVGCFLAIFSYHYVEPLGRGVKRLYVWSAIFGATLLSLAAYLKWHAPRLPAPYDRPTWWNGALYESRDVTKHLAECRESHRFDNIMIGVPADIPSGMRPVIVNANYGQIRIVVLGDSHGAMWASSIHHIANDLKLSAAFVVASNCPPFRGFKDASRLKELRWEDLNQMRLDLISKEKPAVVLIAARWDMAVRQDYIKGLNELVRDIQSASPASKILLIGQPPVLAIGDQSALQWLSWRKTFGQTAVDSMPAEKSENWRLAKDYLLHFKREHPDINFVETEDLYLANTQRAIVGVGGQAVYIDDDHLSEYGASFAAERIKAAIQAELSK